MLSPKAAAFQVEALLKGHASFERCTRLKDNQDTVIHNVYEDRIRTCNQSEENLDRKSFKMEDKPHNKSELDESCRNYSDQKLPLILSNIPQKGILSPELDTSWRTLNQLTEGRKRCSPMNEILLQRKSKKNKLNQEQLQYPIEENLVRNHLPSLWPYSHHGINKDYHETEIRSSSQTTEKSTQNQPRTNSPKIPPSISSPERKNFPREQKQDEKSSPRVLEGTSLETDDKGTSRSCRTSKKDVVLSLQHRSLWAEFSRHQTEMIVTKNGRRMFPVIKIRVQGLKPDALYMIYLDVVPVDGKRYRYAYLTSTWVVAGAGDTQQRDRLYIHPESPTTGKRWMEMMIISFDKLKLTNNKSRDMKGQIYLQSMQKYLPRIWVQKLQNNCNPNEINGHEIDVNELHTFVDRSQALCFTFPETNFITVTAYQNQKITRLKINTNPFAKGFRDSSKYKDVNRHLMTSLHCGNNNCQSSQHIPYASLPHIRPPFIAPLPFYPTIPFPPPLSHMRPTTLPNRWPSIPSVISSHVDNSTTNLIFNRSFHELGRNEFPINNLRIQKYKSQGEDSDLK